MFLTSVSDLIQVITNATSDIEVHTWWVDKVAATEPVAGRLNIASITTATTTTIVAAPAASTARRVMGMNFHNNHATQSCLLRVTHTDGTTVSELLHATLLAGETLIFDEDGDWVHLDANTDDYPSAINYDDTNLGITGTNAETMPRNLCTETSAALTSGALKLGLIYLRKGTVVTNISFFSSTTASGTPTNGFFALYSVLGALLAQSANFTTEAWAANTIKTKAMTSAYTVPVSGYYYVGVMVTATTPPSLKSFAQGTQLLTYEREIAFTSSTGLTTALPNPALATGAITAHPWAAIT